MSEKKNILSTTEQALKKIAPQKENELKSQIKKKGKQASGKLIASVRSEVSAAGQRVDLEIYAEEYADFIQEGRSKGTFPPAQPIKDWMKIKGIEEKALFPIMKKIKEEGISPVDIISEAQKTESIADVISKALAENLEESLARTIRKNLK